MASNAGLAPDFVPDLLAIQEEPAARLPRVVGYAAAVLFFTLLAWAALGHLDIVATAEAGILRELLVREGDTVRAGDVLLRMDSTSASAGLGTLRADAALQGLGLRRAQRQAYLDAVAQEDAGLQRDRIEKEQQIKTQEAAVAPLADAVTQSTHRAAQIRSTYRSDLLAQCVELGSSCSGSARCWNIC